MLRQIAIGADEIVRVKGRFKLQGYDLQRVHCTNDLFYNADQTEICNFADNTTPHASGYELKDVLLRLEHDSNTLLEWF